MSSLLKAAVLGVLQGVTEFLPVSSTAHLLIAGRLIGFDDPGGVFTIMIQLGSILAIMWLYREKIAHVVAGLASDRDARHFALSVILATMVAAFGNEFLNARHNLSTVRGEEIAVGFVMAFLASLLVVRPFLSYVRQSGFAPFAWYRIVLGTVLLAAARQP